MAYLAVVLNLILDLHRDVDRDRESETLETAAAAEDLRIDADDFALEVE